MNPPGIQDLPPEVFHMILEYLGSNKALLRNCSLVCRSWLRASRPRLFDVVSLYACERRLLDFLGFLDTHPDIPDHVRFLMLHKPMDDQPPGADGAPDPSVTAYTLARTARRLPRLRQVQLYFVNVAPSRLGAPSAEGAQSVPPVDLGALHVFGSAHQELGPFLELLAQFRTDRLELELVTFELFACAPPPPAATLAGRIYVRDLSADLEAADEAHVAILGALAPTLSPGVLQSFQCSWREWDGCKPVGQFLRDVGGSLTELTLNMSVMAWVEERDSAIPREDWAALGLDACTHIRTFRMSIGLSTVCSHFDLAETRRTVTSYAHLLAGLPTSVHTVIIQMSATPPYAVGRPGRISTGGGRGAIPVDFEEIEEALLCLPGLARVVISMRPAQDRRRSAASAAAAFPMLQDRGVLEVRSGSLLADSSSW